MNKVLKYPPPPLPEYMEGLCSEGKQVLIPPPGFREGVRGRVPFGALWPYCNVLRDLCVSVVSIKSKVNYQNIKL